MKTQLLAIAVIVLAFTQVANAGDCGCSAPAVATCDTCCPKKCNSCCNPLGDLVHGIGFTLKQGACKVKQGVHCLFHPITFHGCRKQCQSSCGCGTTATSMHYDYSSPSIEYIEPSMVPSEAVPAPPQPEVVEPTYETSEPIRFNPPASGWKSTNHSARSSSKALYYSRLKAAKAQQATYYAPSKK